VARAGLGFRRVIQAHPVTPGVLGPVQGQVRGREELEQVPAEVLVAFEGRDADRDRDADRRVGDEHPYPVSSAAEALRDAAGLLRRGVGEQNDELLAADLLTAVP